MWGVWHEQKARLNHSFPGGAFETKIQPANKLAAMNYSPPTPPPLRPLYSITHIHLNSNKDNNNKLVIKEPCRLFLVSPQPENPFFAPSTRLQRFGKILRLTSWESVWRLSFLFSQSIGSGAKGEKYPTHRASVCYPRSMAG